MPARRLLAALVVAAILATTPAAARVDPPGLYEEVSLLPAPGRALDWQNTRYAGRLIVRGAPDGLVVAELVDPETYLLGIQEVPFGWPEEALKAQAVAARTYLAWTLERGRAGAGARYGFDICATAACQVYGGLDQVEGPDGERWAEAVRDTEGEMLLSGGTPVQALYSSTTGGRTRSVQDVFGGRAVPYLQAVPSPGEDSPFAAWEFDVPAGVLGAILRQAEVIDGRLLAAAVQSTADGAGPWMVELRHDGGVERLTTWEFRGVMNRYGPEVAPELLPAERPDGRRYPQTVLSPTYAMAKEYRYPEAFRSGYIVVDEAYRFAGNGWGHLVGMSQYGAKAMADRGSDYRAILSHYYGGLVPVDAVQHLPGEIAVGIAWGAGEVGVTSGGPITVAADGVEIAAGALGSWRFEPSGGDVAVYPPEGFGLPPALRDFEPELSGRSGRSVVISGTLAAAAEVRLVVFRGARVVGETAWTIREAGPIALAWDGTADGEIAPPATYRLLVEARSPEGSADVFATLRLRPPQPGLP